MESRRACSRREIESVRICSALAIESVRAAFASESCRLRMFSESVRARSLAAMESLRARLAALIESIRACSTLAMESVRDLLGNATSPRASLRIGMRGVDRAPARVVSRRVVSTCAGKVAAHRATAILLPIAQRVMMRVLM
jgi:hypothetical protein